MEIVIKNPYFVTPTIGYSMDGQATEAQIIRIVEKLLLSKSLVAENIQVNYRRLKND